MSVQLRTFLRTSGRQTSKRFSPLPPPPRIEQAVVARGRQILKHDIPLFWFIAAAQEHTEDEARTYSDATLEWFP